MKKFLLITGGVLLLLALGCYIGLQFFLGSVVTAAVNRLGPGITHTKVELGATKISPFSGQGKLSSLTIGNPNGWSSADLFHVGELSVHLKPFSIFGDYIMIDEIMIDSPEINYETKLFSSNVADLLKNVEAVTSGGKPADPKAKNGAPLKLVVKKFTLTNARVSLGIGAKAMTIPMPPVELTDLGVAQGGITPTELATAVLRSITSSVVAASTEAIAKTGKTSGAAATEGIKKAGDAIKGFFGGKK